MAILKISYIETDVHRDFSQKSISARKMHLKIIKEMRNEFYIVVKLKPLSFYFSVAKVTIHSKISIH